MCVAIVNLTLDSPDTFSGDNHRWIRFPFRLLNRGPVLTSGVDNPNFGPHDVAGFLNVDHVAEEARHSWYLWPWLKPSKRDRPHSRTSHR